MIELPYSLIIEATAEPDYLPFTRFAGFFWHRTFCGRLFVQGQVGHEGACRIAQTSGSSGSSCQPSSTNHRSERKETGSCLTCEREKRVMKSKVYIETTILSFYHEDRIDPEVIARREWTKEWWNNHRDKYIVVTSPAVLNELGSRDYPDDKRNKALNLVKDLLLVSIESEIVEIVQVYIQHKVMPADPVGDALHLALASFHKCDFLLTWNCKHLANANKYPHIRRVNSMLGLYVPLLVTPIELLGEE